MHRLPQMLAILAIMVLLVGAPVLVTGIGESARQDARARVGLREIPRDSEFVRSLLAEPLQDDLWRWVGWSGPSGRAAAREDSR